MAFLDEFLLLFRFAAECYVADFIFIFTLERRNKFGARLAASAAASLALLCAFAAVCAYGFPKSQTAEAVCFALILAPMNLGWLAFCFRDSVWNVVFCAVFGLLTKLGAINIIEAVKALPFGWLDFFVKESAWGLVLQYAIIAVVYVSVYFIFGKRYERSDSFTKCGKRMIPLYVFTALAMPLLSYGGRTSGLEPWFYVLLDLFGAAICFLVVNVQFSFAREMISAGRKSSVDALLVESQKQFETLKESIEIINLKCHDIRHQIRSADKSKIDGAYLAELENTISIYDSSVKTGNDVLNVILTDKSLRCAANGIEFTCIADGKRLSFMSDSDINSLFGNALENAMEYETTVADREKRFVSLLVRCEANVLFVRVENYWQGEALILRDGLPATTKGSESSHGFGMLSMKRIVEKYGGQMQVTAADELFTVSIAIPLE